MMQTTIRLYRPATCNTLNTIRQRNQAGKATFLLSSQPVFAESAQAAYLLCEYINSTRDNGAGEIYKTFFCNSRIEALHGAIKISRHNGRFGRSNSDGMVLVYDDRGYYDELFDPLRQGPNQALVPGVFFYRGLSDLLNHLEKPGVSVCAVIVCLSDESSVVSLNAIQERCEQKNTIVAIDTSDGSDDLIESAFRIPRAVPDIVIWGEALTDHQVPFGAFSMVDDVYKAWRTVDTCFLHSSTYGGNSLATSIVRDELLRKLRVAPDIGSRLQEIESNPDARIAAFRTYVNPLSPLVYQAAKLDLDIVRANGSWITVKGPHDKEIGLIDCIGGAGSNLRGYNPGDIAGKVLEAHDPARDYWHELGKELCALAGLDHAFPAVSGACAVEIAMTLAMLANSKRSRILVFRGNYAGKTLISLNGSEEEPLRKPFEPLYRDVVYLDIFSGNAAEALLEELRSGSIALVWFEVLQGDDLGRISPELLEIIFKHKEEYGYFVGIDEILNGMFRTGPLFSFDRSRYQPDIVTLSKGLSDMTFPISATLTSGGMYRRAMRVNAELVARYQVLFLNQLGAHIALNGLAHAIAANIEDRVGFVGNLLKSGLSEIAEQSPLLKEIRGEGLHLHLVLDMEKFPLSLFGKTVSELLISRLCVSEGQVLQFFCRLLPPLSLSDSDVRELTSGIEKAFGISRFSLFLFGMKRIIVFAYFLMADRLTNGTKRFLRQVAGFGV